MANSLKDLLKNHSPREPAEFEVIRKFVQKELGIIPSLTSNASTIIITVGSAAMAGDLRYKLHTLQKTIDKKLLIRIRQN
jgi:hypothetical protein